jgi:hypothetical protein
MWVLALTFSTLAVCYLAWRRRSRARTLARLQVALKKLGYVLASAGFARGELVAFETIEAGQIVLRIEGKQVRLDVLKVLNVVENSEPQFVRERLLWLVRQAR